MRKNVIKLLLIICLLCLVALAVTACKGVKMTISFVVDNETYATIDTSGNEIVTIPQSPVKDGYTFDGWYWDKDTWQRPFTANSLLNEPLTSNMSVYAKFSIIHNHVLTLQPAVKADCEHIGNDAYYTCTCGKLFADAQATVELTAIPTINKTEHTPTDWIVDNKATCTEDGSKHTECSVCHTTLQTETIPSNGHTPETEWRIDKTAQCTIDGSKHLECFVCHATLQTDVIRATGHSYSTEWSKDEHGHWHVATCEHTTETTAIEPHTYDSNYKCKICSYQDTSLHGTEIATDVFTVEGETLYAKTPNSQPTFSFINAIQVADGATFVVATDLAASNVIRTKTVSLEIGDNTYYILVENGNDIQLYTVTLRRRPIYTVTFVTNGGTDCESQQVEEDSHAIEPITSKTGYTFVNWDYNFATPVTQNTTITASWAANEYTVTYDVNGGVLTDTRFTATYDSAYILAVPTREGHTFQGWYVDDTQITYADGQSRTNWTYTENKTATAKWTINSYTLTITNPNSNAGTVTGDGTYVYSNEVTVTASEPNLGYDWIGWYDGNTLLSTELTYTFNMPAKNLSLTPYKVKDEMSNFNFTSTTTTCTITGVKKTVTEIVIPDYVTSIGNYAFNGCSGLTSVRIPNNVTSIGSSAFNGCSKLANINFLGTIESWCNIQGLGNLMQYGTSSKTFSLNGEPITELVIPSTVTSIPSSAFRNCTKITSVTISDSVTSIGSSAFENFNSLQKITIPFVGANKGGTSNTHFGYIFGANSYSNNLSYVPPSLKTVVITGGNTIYDNAFLNCSNITSITIPDSVTSIYYQAFYDCSNLTNITIPDSVTSIGGSTNYLRAAFIGCSKLFNINYLGTIESWCNIQGFENLMLYGINNKMLSINGEQVTELVIPSTLTSIPSYAFAKTNIISVSIPDSVTSVGSGAFYGCISLENITIPFVGASKDGTENTHFGYIFGAISVEGTYNSIAGKNTNGNADSVPSSLKTVVITGGSTIAVDAFRNCFNITNVAIPNSVTSINSGYNSGKYWGMFSGCSNLSSIVIPDSVTTIGKYAFQGCSNLTSVNYLGTIESWCNIQGLNYLMQDGASSKTLSLNGESITELVIPSALTSIPSYVFANTNITSVTIPDSLKSIGSYAFSGCSKLANVNYLGTIESWCKIQWLEYLMNYGASDKMLVIDGKEITGDLVIPDTVTYIPSYAFAKTNITSVSIPNGITVSSTWSPYVGYLGPFNGCSKLANINYLGTIESWCSIQGVGSLMQDGMSSKTFSLNGEPVTELVIPDTVASIPSRAFYKTNITSVTIPDSVKSIGSSAFYNCYNLETVYYEGDADQWDNISISSENDTLTSATRYYYSETEPELNADGTAYDGNYWHYNDNHEVVVWEYKKENN